MRDLLLALAASLVLTGCAPSETQNVKKYMSSLKTFPTELVGHFPTARPDKDADPVFSYFPGFLQGGAHLQLRVRLKPKEVESLSLDLRSKTEHIYQGGSFFTHYNDDQDNNLPTASYHTQRDDADAIEFPQHFTLYVLDATQASGSWNHGSTYGIAISEETNETIYWAENW